MVVVITGIVAALLTTIVPSGRTSAQTTSGRGALVPLVGQSYTTTFNGPNVHTVGDLEIDEAHGLVFVSFPVDNIVYALNLDGTI